MSLRCVSLAILLAPLGWGQGPADLTLTLAPKDGRTKFRLGEAVGLELRFQSSAAGRYAVWTTSTARTVRNAKFDHFTVVPSNGVADPLVDTFAQSSGEVLRGRPPEPVPLDGGVVTVGVFLNEWLSIRQPGRYRISAETTRVVMTGPPASSVPLSSNAIEIDVTAPEPGWAEAQLKQAVTVLERGDPPQPRIGQPYDPNRESQLREEAAQAARVLRFLETREAAEAVVRFYEHGPEMAQGQLGAGLWATPHRKEVMAALEKAVAAPDVGITYSYLAVLIELATVTRFGPMPPFTPKTSGEIGRWIREVEAPYQERAKGVHADAFAKLAAAIPRKRGPALAISLQTLILHGPQPPAASAMGALFDNFKLLPESSQQQLLTSAWPRIGSPAAEPLLKSIAEGGRPLRDSALARLREVNPDAARLIAIDRIRRVDVSSDAYRSYHVLFQLPDKTLPELDDALVSAVEQRRPEADLLLARYASGAVYERVRAYEERTWMCSAGILAYLFRVDPGYAVEHLAQLRSANPNRCSVATLSSNEELFMTPALEKQAIRDLAVPAHVRTALAMLQWGGSVGAKQALMDAMRHWREDPPEPGGYPLENLDAHLAAALLTGAGWVLTQKEMDGVMAACSTDYCRERVVYFRSLFDQPLRISIEGGASELTYVRVGPFDLRSPRQLGSKIAQFPKGTAFSILPTNVGTWWRDRHTREVRAILDANGMKLVDPAPQ
jgi:hypothetical protein